MNTLIINKNNYYRTNLGNAIAISKSIEEGDPLFGFGYRFVGSNGFLYRSDGTSGTSTDHHLIEEITTEPVVYDKFGFQTTFDKLRKRNRIVELGHDIFRSICVSSVAIGILHWGFRII